MTEEPKRKSKKDYLKEYYTQNKDKYLNKEAKKKYYDENKKKIKLKSRDYYKSKKIGTQSQNIELFLENE